MNFWHIFLIVVVILLFLFVILHSIKICEGGLIMQGCGKFLFPWTKKHKLPPNNTYCCEECFKRDYKLLMDAPSRANKKLHFTLKEELYGIDPDEGDD